MEREREIWNGCMCKKERERERGGEGERDGMDACVREREMREGDGEPT